jgi:hypothetical protein
MTNPSPGEDESSVPISYPQLNSPGARQRFEYAATTPSWVGATSCHQTGPRTLAERLSKVLGGNGIEASTMLSTGTVDVALDEYKFRRPVTGRRPWVTGMFVSRKIGRPVEYESMNEAALIKEMEVDPGVWDFRSQPVRFYSRSDEKHWHYTLDFLRLRADGIIEAIEIKSEPDVVLRDLEYFGKLQRVLAICHALDWKFSVYFGRDLRAQNVFNFNIQTLYLHINVPVLQRDIASTLRMAERRGTAATLGEIIDLYQSPQQGAAKVFRMIGRGIVSADLTRKLTRSSSVAVAEVV